MNLSRGLCLIFNQRPSMFSHSWLFCFSSSASAITSVWQFFFCCSFRLLYSSQLRVVCFFTVKSLSVGVFILIKRRARSRASFLSIAVYFLAVSDSLVADSCCLGGEEIGISLAFEYRECSFLAVVSSFGSADLVLRLFF